MKPFSIVTDTQIRSLGITPDECVEWVREAFLHKGGCILSPKISQKPTPDSFFNTMPCCIPSFNRMGVKVVSRLPGNVPPLKSVVNLFDLTTGDLLAVMEADWITAMRTGAVAALAAKTFAADFSRASFGFVGLGTTAAATMECLASQLQAPPDVWLLEYKNRASAFADRFSTLSNLSFHIAHSREELVERSSVLFSCPTVMHEQFLPPERFPAGCTLIPVHTKGFQDCDPVFDHVFGDDLGHISEFRRFREFRTFAEFADVLSGRAPGRLAPSERILSYNVGIALHDVWFASRLFCRLSHSPLGTPEERTGSGHS
jgi:ornithine cyclodeaminase/alanine dehydrogenase-like protein (mu-crystallin family)